jgi:hypothetical protein
VAVHTAGTGLSGSTFNGSTAVTWTLNTATVMGYAINIANGVANQIPYQTGSGATTFNSGFTYNGVTFTATNLSLVYGTGARIQGDFSNSSNGSRILFQTTQTGGNSSVGVIPASGNLNSGIISDFTAYANSAPTIGAATITMGIGATGGTPVDARIATSYSGAASYLPLTLYTSNLERLRVGVQGGVSINTTTDYGSGLYVYGASTFTNYMTIGSGTNGGIFQTLAGGSSFALYSTNLTPSASNYALAYNGASLNLNAPTSGGIYSSINNSIVTTLNSTGLQVNVTTLSASTNSGALQVAGGAGIGGNLNIGGVTTATGQVNITVTTGTNNAVNITYVPVSTQGAAIFATGANTQGGSGYFDFLKASNTGTGYSTLTNTKSFRLTSVGEYQIINSGYTKVLFSLADTGAVTLAGNLTMAGLDIAPGAFLTTGTSGTLNLSTTTSYNFIYASAGSLTTTLAFPASPADGTIVRFTVVSSTATTIALSGGTFVTAYSGSTVQGVTVGYLYNGATTNWYRIQ